MKVFVSAYLTTAAQRWKCWRGQCWMTGVEDESSGVGVGVKVGSQRARPGIKMWQLNKWAQVKRSFQSDPSVWRWSWLCPTPPPPAAAAALPLSASLKSRDREKHDCACLCLWLLCVQLWMYVSVYIWAKRGKATDLVFLIVRSHFSVSLLLSVPLFYLPSPPFFFSPRVKSELMTFSVSFLCFFVSWWFVCFA